MGLDLTKIMELWALCDKTDGGSRPAVSDGAAVDFVTGETIPTDAPVTEYYDADGNVYATCIKPVTDAIKTAGEEIPAGTIITDPPADFDQSLLDTNGALIAPYIATSTWIFDGDEACSKGDSGGPLPVYKKCGGDPLTEDDEVHTTDNGGIGYITSIGANPNNPTIYDPSCVPPESDCPSNGDITFNRGITWQRRNGVMRAVAATSCSESGFVTAAVPEISDAELQALFADNGVGVDIVIDSREICFINEDCLRHYTRWIYRYNFGGVLSGGNYITGGIRVDTNASDVDGSHFCGTPNERIDTSCNDPSCVQNVRGAPIWGHSPQWGILAGANGSASSQRCVKVDFVINFAQDYLPDDRNLISTSAFCLGYETTRDTRTICNV